MKQYSGPLFDVRNPHRPTREQRERMFRLRRLLFRNHCFMAWWTALWGDFTDLPEIFEEVRQGHGEEVLRGLVVMLNDPGVAGWYYA